MKETRRLFDMPMTCAEIKRKVAAWKEIYQQTPRILVSGEFYTADGEIAFGLYEARVTKIGREYLHLKIDGKADQIDPLRRVQCGLRSSLALVSEEAR